MDRSAHQMNTARSSEQGLVFPSEAIQTVDRSTRGLSGRVWTLAIGVEVSGRWDGSNKNLATTWRGMSEYSVAKHACEFLRHNEPDLYASWHHTAQDVVRRTRAQKVRAEKTGEDALLETDPGDTAAAALKMPAVAGERPEEIVVRIPRIGRGHWLYDRHREAGHGVTRPATPQECDYEAEQDVRAIMYYLKAYESLAGERIGRRLFEASVGAQFRDPYTSCMELCLFDLKLPPHFMALVHYGIGAHFAVGDAFKHWDGRKVKAEECDAVLSTKRVFRQLMKLWNEDFARS
jgi:hypothetical protein